MANTKSARKAARVAQRRRLENKARKTTAKAGVTQARKLIEARDLEAAGQVVRLAASALDKAAQRGAIHPNNAARRKSRLMKRLNAAQASATSAPQ